MSHQLWKLANGAAVLVGSCASPEGLAPMESALPKGTVIARVSDGLVNASNGSAKELAIFRAAVAGAYRHRPEPVTRGTGGRKPPASRPSPRPFVGGVLTETAAPATPAAPPAPPPPQPTPKPRRVPAKLARTEYRAEQLRGEVEGLTTDLTVARHDLARVTARSNELRQELAEAHALLALALSAGLAAAEEARAEADRVARHAGELSRRLAAAKDELNAARVETAPALDELALARLIERSATSAARKVAAHDRDAARLLKLARENGGVDTVVRIVESAMRLLKAVG